MKNTLSGQHFVVSPNSILLFGLQGLHSGDYWAVGVPFGETYVLTEVDPAPVLSEINQVITEDTKAGNASCIDHILCSSRTAVCLFLEGALTFGDFKQAQETSQSIRLSCSTLPSPLHIVSEFETTYSFATCTADGSIV